MPTARRTPLLVALLLLSVVAAWLVSCSQKGSTYATQPNPPAANAELNGNLSTSGTQYGHTFSTAGTFHYHCSLHPTCSALAGTVVVVAPGTLVPSRQLSLSFTGGGTDPYGYATCSALSPQLDTVFVGDHVTWTNNSALPHTVVSQ